MHRWAVALIIILHCDLSDAIMDQVELLHDDENEQNTLQGKSMDYEQGNETGYVTDSSLNSRQGTQKKSDIRYDRAYVNRRKTKSERDKKRKGSLPESHNDSESETSDDTQNQPKYRKRASSKRLECDKENFDQRQHRGSRRGSAQLICCGSQEEIIEDVKKSETKPIVMPRQRRDSRINSFVVFNFDDVEPSDDLECSPKEERTRESCPQSNDDNQIEERVKEKEDKESPVTPMISQKIEVPPLSGDEVACVESQHQQQQQLSMDNILSPKEVNLFENEDEIKPNHRPSSTTTLKMNLKDIYSGTWDPKEKAVFNLVLQNMDTKCDKKNLTEKFKIKTHQKTTTLKEENLRQTMYPIKEYMKPLENNRKFSKKTFSGFFAGFKWFRNVLKRHDRSSKLMESEYVFPKDPLLDLITPKKKSIFRIFRKKKNNDIQRRRAQSTNSHYSVEYLLNSDQNQNSMNRMHGSFATLTSMKGMFKKTKSEDNLNGAFEFFANQTHVFQRTASVSKKSKSRTGSSEQLEGHKRVASQSSINHVFAAVQTRDERDVKEQLVFAEAEVAATQKAHQHNIPSKKNSSYKEYDSAFDGTIDSFFSSVTKSVPNYSYMSADSFSRSTTVPYTSHINHGDYDKKKYAIQGTNDSGFGTVISNVSALSSYSSESGFGTGNISRKKLSAIPQHERLDIPGNTSKVNTGKRENERTCFSSDFTVHENESKNNPLVNSFHQRRFKTPYSYMV